jgi:threonine dehydrogenase-like Zn-dependent dehydrogenase
MLCPGRRLLGAAAPGGLQELLTVPERHLFALPDGVEPALGALAEPLAVALRGVDLAALVPGMKVAVLGAGTIGLAALLLSRQAAAEVAVTARYGHQAELVRSFGGTAIPADDNARRALSAFAPDVVIETVGGAGETLTEALEVVRPGGTVVALGVFTGRPEVPALKIVLREVTLVGSLMYGTHSGRSEFGAAVALLPRLAPELERLQTHWFELEQAPSAFATAADKASGAVKVTLRVGA